MLRWVRAVLGILFIAPNALTGDAGSDVAIVAPAARVQTDPVPNDGDAADDPAVWIHPTDPARSLVIATDKKGGLHSYGLDGRQRQVVSPRSHPNNVDLIYGFSLAGRKTDLAVASVGKEGKSPGIKVWTIDAHGSLAELGEGPTFTPSEGGAPYGLCTYRSPRDGSVFLFVSDRDGLVQQYRLGGSPTLSLTRVRAFAVGSQVEGMVADRERARLFVGEETVGIWEYGAEPGDGTDRRAVARVGEHGLTADVEGLALYSAPGGKGYLIASSQGNSTLNVYDRTTHAYVLTIDPRPGTIDDVAHTDGLDVTHEATSPQFPRGLLVVQDGENEGRQNFKLFAWDDIAAGRLVIDTTPSTRP